LIPTGNKITILLVDNQPTTVAGLRALFSKTKALKLLAKGWSNKQIALALDVSTSTVAFHVKNVMKKLGVNSRNEAAIWAIKNMSDNLA